MPLTAASTSDSTAVATDEKIACYCPNCPINANLLLTCRNAWAQISNSYFLNVIERDYLQDAQGIKSADQRGGSGQLEGCQLETLRCKRCTHLVGTRCLEAPPEKKEFQGCYLLKLKFFILKSASTGNEVEPFIVADTQSSLSESTFESTTNLAQPKEHESNGPAAPVFHGLTSRPASSIPSEIPSSKTLSNDPSSATPLHQSSNIRREQVTSIDELSDTVRQLQAETSNLRQAIKDMRKSQPTLPSLAVVDSQANEIRSLHRDMQILRDRMAILEKANKALSSSSQVVPSPSPSLVNGKKRSFAQSNGVETDSSVSRNSLLARSESSIPFSAEQDAEMKDAKMGDITASGYEEDGETNTSVGALELATRHMIPSSVSESNGDVAGEMVVGGDTNPGTALEELGPGEVNGNESKVTHTFNSTAAFAKPALPPRRIWGMPDQLDGSQGSEYIPSATPTETTATPSIRPASFVPLNRNQTANANRERMFDSPPVAIEGWDNSQDADYRPSGEVSTGATFVTPESTRPRGRGRGRGSGNGSRGDREAFKFKNHSARLTEPAPWERDDWDGTTGTMALIKSPSSRGRTVKQRGLSSTNRTLDIDTPTGAHKKSRLVNSDPRPRDEAGRLLRANGMVDKRSERYVRKKKVPEVANDVSPATPAKIQPAVPITATTDSPKTHEDFMNRIYPKGRPVEEAIDDNMALR